MTSKILIVDDQFGIRLLLSEVLKKEGYHTMQAANGPDAIVIAKAEYPDLVLLDMKIPGMDGLEILRHMKADNPNIQTIIMTAYGELDMIQEVKKMGAIMHLPKPFDIDEIRETVKKHLQK